MRTRERGELHKEIKSCAIKNFEIEIKDEELDEYGIDRLIKIIEKMNEVVRYGDERWVVSYSKHTFIDFLESIFRYDTHSNFYAYSDYTVEKIVEDEFYDFIQDYVVESIMDCIDIKKYAENYMSLEKAEYGYITTW